MTEREAFPALARRYSIDAQRQPWTAKGKWFALAFIEQAERDFRKAITDGSPRDQEDAALDLAAKCLRFAAGEHLPKKENKP